MSPSCIVSAVNVSGSSKIPASRSRTPQKGVSSGIFKTMTRDDTVSKEHLYDVEDGDDAKSDSDSIADLWDVDKVMTHEEITAALAEEKRRKKVRQ